MGNIKVSIIIPVYNAEQYLEECLCSCVNQTLRDIEVIIVNDASADNSAAIMKAFEEEYPNKVRCVYLEENVRQGGARNIGIKMARGEYLCFVDADDYIDLSMCEKLYMLCKCQNLQIASCQGYRLCDDKRLVFDVFTTYDFSRYKSILNFTSQCYMLIDRNVIIGNAMYYPEHIFHEDLAVVPIWYLLAERKQLLNEPLYYRRVHSLSTTQSLNIGGIIQILEITRYTIDNAKRVGVYDVNKSLLDVYIFQRVITAAVKLNEYEIKPSPTEQEYLKNIIQELAIYSWDTSFFVKHFLCDEYELAWNLLESGMVGESKLPITDSFRWNEPFERMKQLVEELQKRNYQIVVWGCGKKGIPIIKYFKDEKLEYAVGDNNQKLWDKCISTGDIVHDVEWIKNNLDNPVILVTAAKYFNDIISGLSETLRKVDYVDIWSYIVYDLNIDDVL